MAFNQLDFLPSIANAFLMDVALHWFIYRRFPISGILTSHQVLGSHTDVFFFFQNGEVSRVTWSHPGIRPFGTPLPIQCTCKSLKPWSPHVTLNRAQNDLLSMCLVCKYCGYSVQHLKPANLRRVGSGKMEKSDAGVWYVEDM
jgi:hypothetical protein